MDAVNLIAGTGNEYADIIEGLCNLATTGICKINNKGCIPWAAMRYVLEKGEAYRTWLTDAGGEAMDGTIQIFSLESPAAAAVSETILKMDYTGKGFWNVLKALKDAKLKVKVKPATDMNIMRQHIMMSMTQLSMDDIAIYKFILVVDAISRKDYGETFQSRKSAGESKEVKLIAPVYVCKFATAILSKLGASNREAAIPLKTKAGMAKHNVDNMGTMLNSLVTGRGFTRRGNQNPADIVRVLSQQQAGIHKSITASGTYVLGTTSWFKADATSTRECYGEQVDDVPVMSEKTIFEM